MLLNHNKMDKANWTKLKEAVDKVFKNEPTCTLDIGEYSTGFNVRFVLEKHKQKSI